MRKFFVSVFSLFVLASGIVAVTRAVHSPLFILQKVEWTHHPKEYTVKELLPDLSIGGSSLFSLDLRDLEKKILSREAVKRVRIQKRLPHTLAIDVTYREPRALFLLGRTKLALVDDAGVVFGSYEPGSLPDLPLLSGFSADDPTRIRQALRVISFWEKGSLSDISEISSIHWDTSQGFKVLAYYSKSDQKGLSDSGPQERSRTVIDFGRDLDANLETGLSQLGSVFRYLHHRTIAAHQIWVDSNRKIIVKKSFGSF